MIPASILKKYGARLVQVKKDEPIFSAGDAALHYFQMETGVVKMITTSADGQEFIQGIFRSGESFGEPPLFCSFNYPSTAKALEQSSVYKLSKNLFFLLLEENFELHLAFDRILCERLKYKSMILSEISFHDPEHRIMSLLEHLKITADSTSNSIREDSVGRNYVVPFTRQQLADMSGLRVETVIRTVKQRENTIAGQKNYHLKLIKQREKLLQTIVSKLN